MNALGTLFAAIAEAIRSKNGDPASVKYKPTEFPAKISELGSLNIKAASGLLEPKSRVETVAHGLGVTPDIILVLKRYGSGSEAALSMAIGANTAIIQATGGELNNAVYSESGGGAGLAYGIESNKSTLASYGMIRGATETTFTVGGESQGFLLVGDDDPETKDPNYLWYAIGGIC